MDQENQTKSETKIVIIGGFLGSGKTTAIIEIGKMLSSAGKKIAYFTNEIGEIALDGNLMNYDIETQEVTMACISCNIKEAVSSAVSRLIEAAAPDILMIEPRENISPLVVKDELEKASLKANREEYQFAPHFTFIDGTAFFKNMKEKKKVAADQIMVSEIIVLNKTDLMKKSEIEMIQESIRQMNPAAEIIENNCKNESGLKEIIEKIGN
jgi:Putative GTPases (G3E family)